jgi:hypothetical protein
VEMRDGSGIWRSVSKDDILVSRFCADRAADLFHAHESQGVLDRTDDRGRRRDHAVLPEKFKGDQLGGSRPGPAGHGSEKYGSANAARRGRAPLLNVSRQRATVLLAMSRSWTALANQTDRSWSHPFCPEAEILDR